MPTRAPFADCAEIPRLSNDYFIGVHDREVDRLRKQHAAWLPETRALWARAGFGGAQRVADLGCGPGFSTFELATLVGVHGEVIALDKAQSYLAFLAAEARAQGLDSIRTMQADLVELETVEGGLDGAFCRWFLAFLVADLEPALRCIFRSLKPGGVLAAMEYLTVDSATASPPLRGFDAHTQAWVRYYRENGGDTRIGSVLPAKLEAAGFSIESIEAVGGIAYSGHRWWTWWGRLIEDFGAKLTALGHMSADELRHLQADWHGASGNPRAFIHTPVLVQIVARKS
jgi:ubiquinone/menaquinone biosynthesis C-methylase UbiE